MRIQHLKHPALTRGFTLIELLVVISIIALLISIVLPTLQNVRQSVRSTACLSNQRQLMTAWHSHATEHNGTAMYSQTANTQVNGLVANAERHWFFEMNEYLPMFTEASILLCPQADFASGRTDSNVLNGDYAHGWWFGPDSRTHFSPTDPGAHGGYGYNNMWEFDASEGGNPNWGFLADEGFKTVDHAQMPSQTPVFADSTRPDIGFPNTANSVGFPDYLDNAAINRAEDNFLFRDTFRLTMSRHGQIGSTNTATSGVNMSMADGSVRFLPVQDLGRVQWSRVFEQHAP